MRLKKFDILPFKVGMCAIHQQIRYFILILSEFIKRNPELPLSEKFYFMVC